MTPHDYLVSVLRNQEPENGQVATLRAIRGEIESKLRLAVGSAPRFYYGGSYAKGTMIRECFDLDIVVYHPAGSSRTMADLFNSTGTALQQAGYIVRPKTVAWHLPYDGGFHVDVVPGRAQDLSYLYATLFTNTPRAGTLQTSLKKHIDAVSKTGLADIVRLLKVWRLRHGVPLTTFAMEILTARALDGFSCSDYGSATMRVLMYIRDQIPQIRLVDPANSNNIVEIASIDRGSVQRSAGAAIVAPYWEEIIW